MLWRIVPYLLALLSSLAARPAGAAALDFTPTRVELAPGQAAASLEVANRGGGVTAIQVRAFLWTQTGDHDQLTPTDDIIVAPPIFTLPEGESQVIRLLLRARRGGTPHAYRLLIDEVPPPGRNQQVTFAIRASLPVFVDRADGGRIDLQWRAESGGAVLAARNIGHRFAVIRSVEVALPGGRRLPAKALGQNGYVLPGAERHWRVPETAARGGRLHLIVATQAGNAEQDIQAVP